jgi:carbohydrate-selective porin OprB
VAEYQFVDIYPDPNVAPTGAGQGGSGIANPDYPGLPAGAVPDSADKTITTAATTVLWTPPADRRIVVLSVQISTDTAMRIMVVDDVDNEGRRIAGGWFAANGGLSGNLIPAPYEGQTPGAPIRVVTAGAGNVFVVVRGYLRS